MRGGFTNIYTYLWLVVDNRQPGILDGPNSLPKQGIWPAILALEEIWNPIQEMSLSHGDTFSCILGQNWGFFCIIKRH